MSDRLRRPHSNCFSSELMVIRPVSSNGRGVSVLRLNQNSFGVGYPFLNASVLDEQKGRCRYHSQYSPFMWIVTLLFPTSLDVCVSLRFVSCVSHIVRAISLFSRSSFASPVLDLSSRSSTSKKVYHRKTMAGLLMPREAPRSY